MRQNIGVGPRAHLALWILYQALLSLIPAPCTPSGSSACVLHVCPWGSLLSPALLPDAQHQPGPATFLSIPESRTHLVTVAPPPNSVPFLVFSPGPPLHIQSPIPSCQALPSAPHLGLHRTPCPLPRPALLPSTGICPCKLQPESFIQNTYRTPSLPAAHQSTE